MDTVELVLEEIRSLRAEVAAVGLGRGLPQVLTMKRAAEELSVSESTLKGMIRASEVLTVQVGKRRMVPSSEIHRIASPKIHGMARTKGKTEKEKILSKMRR